MRRKGRKKDIYSLETGHEENKIKEEKFQRKLKTLRKSGEKFSGRSFKGKKVKKITVSEGFRRKEE